MDPAVTNLVGPKDTLADEESDDSDIAMLPRPCSMPSFDRNIDSAIKRGMQTLPLKRSAKRGLEQYKPWKSMSSSQGLFGYASPAFGTPSYPTHLDMIRGSEIGLSTSDISRHSAQEKNNNLLDSVIHEAKYGQYDIGQKDGDLVTSRKNLGESLHSFSFAPGFSRGSFAPSPGPGLNSSLNASWQFFNFIGGAETGNVLPTTTRNPNKAILTLDGRNSKILVANEIAGKLFGYVNGNLTGMKMSKLFTMKDGFKQSALLEQHIDTEGNIVMISGKVVEAVDCDGNVFPVSLWMKRIHSDGDPRCVAVIEPVQRAVGSFLFNAEGTIIDCDAQFALVHGFASPEEIIGNSILHLIPAFMLPIPGHEIGRSIKKQTATGKTRDNTRFPISILISEYDKDFHEMYLRRSHPDELQFSKFMYKGIIWVFSNISGLISVLPNGKIHSCNENFSRMFFGYSDKDLVGKELTDLIPLFYDHVELAEDRSLKIPSISDDGDIQLDPKLHTAMSGLVMSSQADFYSDIESLGDGSDYVQDSKEEAKVSNSNSDQTTTSSLTIASDILDNTSIVKSMDDSIASDSSYLTPRPLNVDDSKTESENAAQESSATLGNEAESEVRTDGRRNTITKESMKESLVKGDIKQGEAGLAEFCDMASKESSVTSISSCNKSCCLSEKKLMEKTAKESVIDEQRKHEMASESLKDECLTDNGKENRANNMDFIVVGNNCENHSRQDHQHEKKELSGVEKLETKAEDGLSDLSILGTALVLKDFKDSIKSELDVNEQETECSKADINASTGIDENKHADSVEVEERQSDKEAVGLPVVTRCDSRTEDEGSKSLTDDSVGKRGAEFVDGDGSVLVDKSLDTNTELDNTKESEKTEGTVEKPWQLSQVTSTPKFDRSESVSKKIFEGNFCGQAKHKDGSLLPIVFQIKKITLDRGQDIFCIWVSRDPEEQGEGSRLASQMLLTGSFNSTLNTSHGYFTDMMKGAADLSRSLTEENYKGQYDAKYLTLKSIGKGAFGFVKLAQRRSDSEEVVVKFIQKNKIVPSSWIDDKNLGMVPLEVFYLAKIEHPNVVKMMDVFENDDFFQLVMEKHGEGIDLFEFIDRQPALDEPLCAYMFKQLVSAVAYLHGQNILHRDVKDENIIVDRNFTLKLIDFGSAVFMEEGKLFSTFCGTVEYCSPEVLLGNKYRGPELEVWSMGITLYTLVFGENPFFDVEETIKAELHPPFRVSAELMFLVCWMLHSEPHLRASVKDVLSYKWLNQKVDVNSYDYDTIFAEDRDEYYDRSEDRTTPSSADYDEHYARYDEDYYDEQEYIAENERLEEEYVKYFQRQCSLPDEYEREHGKSF